MTGGAIKASLGSEIDFQGFGAGGSIPNTPLGLQLSFRTSMLTGLSIDFTPNDKENIPLKK